MSDTTSSEEAIKARRSGNLSKLVVPITVVTIICASLIVMILMPHTTSYSISFYGNGSTAGEMYDVEAPEGEDFTLPANEYKRKGYKFDGWVDETTGATYEDEATITVEDDLSLRATWRARLNLRPNGGSGKTKHVYCDDDGNAVFPQCPFDYPDHVFTGWLRVGTEDELYSPNDTFSLDGTTASFLAQWELSQSVKDQVVTSFKTDTSDSGSTIGFLFVDNNSSYAMDIGADFSFKDSDGSEIDWATYTSYVVAPGESTLLLGSSDESGVESVDFDLNIVESNTDKNRTYYSIGSQADLTLENVSTNSVTATLGNTGPYDITLESVLLYATKSDGSWVIQPLSSPEIDDSMTIAPGEVINLEFNETPYSYIDWSVKLYPYGYASSL